MSEAGTPAADAARVILDGGAVHVRTDGEPFFFSSGWASPVFIDLKCLISDPDARGRLIELMLDGISTAYGDAFEQVAGCELAGVPFATLTAHRLDLPLVIALKQARGFVGFRNARAPSIRGPRRSSSTTSPPTVKPRPISRPRWNAPKRTLSEST